MGIVDSLFKELGQIILALIMALYPLTFVAIMEYREKTEKRKK